MSGNPLVKWWQLPPRWHAATVVMMVLLGFGIWLIITNQVEKSRASDARQATFTWAVAHAQWGEVRSVNEGSNRLSGEITFGYCTLHVYAHRGTPQEPYFEFTFEDHRPTAVVPLRNMTPTQLETRRVAYDVDHCATFSPGG